MLNLINKIKKIDNKNFINAKLLLIFIQYVIFQILNITLDHCQQFLSQSSSIKSAT